MGLATLADLTPTTAHEVETRHRALDPRIRAKHAALDAQRDARHAVVEALGMKTARAAGRTRDEEASLGGLHRERDPGVVPR